MLKLPDNLIQLYTTFLFKKALSEKEGYFYKKWLRFYWDFCHKYQHDVYCSDSLPLFVIKLQSKGQSEQQQNQATQAVSLFYEICDTRKQRIKSTVNNSSRNSIDIEITSKIKKNENVNSNALINVEYTIPPSPVSKGIQVTSVQEPDNSGKSWVFVFDALVLYWWAQKIAHPTWLHEICGVKNLRLMPRCLQSQK